MADNQFDDESQFHKFIEEIERSIDLFFLAGKLISKNHLIITKDYYYFNIINIIIVCTVNTQLFIFNHQQ